MNRFRTPTLAMLLAGLAPSAEAITRHVPAEHATIQEAVAAAAAGDTVLVAPGRYTELIEMKDGIVLRSSDGPDSTILLSPGLRDSPLEERVMECPPEVGPSTIIEGLTFDADQRGGTAIWCTSSAPVIRGNVFRGFGWAARLEKHADALIEGNVVEDSHTFGVLASASSPRIVRNRFFRNQPHAITIAGKDAKPVIGGSREDANVIVGSVYANPERLPERHRRDVERLGLGGLGRDGVEGLARGHPDDRRRERPRRLPEGKGRVDYRHWITPEEDGAEAWPDRRMWIVVGLAAVLAIGFVVVARR